MNIQKFNPVTRLYTHSIKATANPRNPDKYLEQQFATFDELPTLKINETAQRNEENTEWVVVDDYRGNVWNTETKEQSVINKVGRLPEGFTELEPDEFGVWDGDKWVIDASAELLAVQNVAINKIFSFATNCRIKIAGTASHLETAEWSEKRLRAIRVVEKTPLPGDIEKLEIEALHRNRSETGEQLAFIIKGKADRFEHASIVITGMTSSAVKLVKDATTIDAIEALYLSLKEKADMELKKLV